MGGRAMQMLCCLELVTCVMNHARRRSQRITEVLLFDLLAPLDNQRMLVHLQ
jgi:hypothetical protein